MQQLEHWETRLYPYLSQIELLGEIPLTQTEHADLEKDLAAFVRRHGLTEATRRLRAEYPASFAVYLAFKAAFNDERGFWDGVARAMGITASLHLPQHHWGKTFLKIIAQYPNLRQFKGISGAKYITPIRLHGGIPAYSLPDFFRFILLPSVEKAPYDGMEDEQALEALLAHYTTTLFVDSVVRYFFQYGGDPAKHLFARTRRMARLALENKPFPVPSELGLRPYLVLNLENYLQNPPEPGKRRRRPRLYLDPYRPGFRVLLPPQPLTLEQASRPCTARLLNPKTGADLGETLPVRTYRRGQDWLTEEVEWFLEEPVENVQVGVYLDGEEAPLMLYPLRLIPAGDFPPLLAARYEDGALRPVSPALPAKNLWLMYPSDARLQIEGEAREIERMFPFAPPWDAWQIQAWDLSQASTVRLMRDGRDICPPIPVSVPDEPMLLGETVHPHSLAVDEKPLYHSAPRLRLPLRRPNRAEQELSDWELRLESRYAAQPAGEWQGRAADLPYEILKDEFSALIDLTPWLDDAPAGTYHLTLNGRGYPRMELPFRACSQLSIEGLEPYYLPDENGAKTASFYIHLPRHARLVDPRNLSEKVGNRWRVKVPGDAVQADLEIVVPSQPEEVRIPLRIAIPRLRWALLLRPGEALEWHHQPISLPLPRLLQAELARFRPRLRVELALPPGYLMQAALHLRLPLGEESLQISENVAFSRGFQDFSLGEFFDTLNARVKDGLFAFVLELQDKTIPGHVAKLPLVHLERAPKIETVHFEARPDGYWTVHWYEPHSLRYRRLRLWNLWQPWAEPVEIPLPDDALPSDVSPAPGWWTHDLPRDIALPPSEYKAQFVIVAPYQKTSIPSTPPSDAITVSLTSPSERLKQIKRQLASLPEESSREFSLHAEKVCIYQTTRRGEEMQDEIKWCLSHWQQANLLHMEALQRWMHRHDPATGRAFLIYMFRKESLEKLKRHTPAFIARYLERFPEAHTVKPENAPLVLEMARDPRVILRALQLLAQSNREGASNYFWKALEERRFSEADAADVLAQHLLFARQLLRNAPPSPLRTRLMRELGRRADIPEFMVKIGHYILSPAGWGKITEIRRARSPAEFIPDEEYPLLLITLLHWPEQQVELDLEQRRLTLLERGGAYLCDCGRFVAPGGHANKSMWEQHQSFCGAATQRPIPASIPIRHELTYTAQILEPLDTRDNLGNNR